MDFIKETFETVIKNEYLIGGLILISVISFIILVLNSPTLRKILCVFSKNSLTCLAGITESSVDCPLFGCWFYWLLFLASIGGAIGVIYYNEILGN